MGLFDKLKDAAKNLGVADYVEAVKKAASTSSATNNTADAAKTPQPVTEKEEVVIEYVLVTDFELKETDDGNYEIAQFVGFEEENMEIPAEINGQRIVGIADNIFAELATLKNIKIAEGIKYIGDKAFVSCPDLETIIFPETLEKIGAYCFSKTPIKRVELPSSIVELGEGIFSECEELRSAVLPEHLEEIPANMFCRCGKLRDITFPTDVSVIGTSAFERSGLILKSLPETLTVIGDKALDDCFQDEDGLHSPVAELRLPGGLKTIGTEGLAGLNCLKLIVPASVEFIGEKAFSYLGCVDGDVEVVFEEGCSAVLSNGIFYNSSSDTDSSIKAITIPSQITEIGELFYGTERAPEYYQVKDEYGRNVYDDYGKIMFDVEYVDKVYSAPPAELTIYCDPGSAAMKYARENGINCAKRVI